MNKSPLEQLIDYIEHELYEVRESDHPTDKEVVQFCDVIILSKARELLEESMKHEPTGDTKPSSTVTSTKS
jgi:hypothetical protein